MAAIALFAARSDRISMTSTMFGLQYFSCQGFVDPDPPANFRTEIVQITLDKQ